MHEIKGEDYSVTYDSAAATVVLRGKLRLYDYVAWQPIERLLLEVTATQSSAITLDIRDLEFINSSGIDMLFRFAYKVSNQAHSWLTVRLLDKAAIWQQRLLSTIEMMVPSLQVERVPKEP